jgi:hypothetical protein
MLQNSLKKVAISAFPVIKTWQPPFSPPPIATWPCNFSAIDKLR